MIRTIACHNISKSIKLSKHETMPSKSDACLSNEILHILRFEHASLWTGTQTHTHICIRSIWLFVILPYLDGEGEWLCRPYCLSHSSLSFSRLSRSLSEESLGEAIATREYQRVHLNTHTDNSVSYFMRILRAMARSSPSRSCKSNTQSSGEGAGQRSCFFNAWQQTKQTHTPVACVPVEGSSLGQLFYPPWLQSRMGGVRGWEKWKHYQYHHVFLSTSLIPLPIWGMHTEEETKRGNTIS